MSMFYAGELEIMLGACINPVNGADSRGVINLKCFYHPLIPFEASESREIQVRYTPVSFVRL